MTISDSQSHKYFWYIMAAAAALLFVRLGAADIYILDEAKNAQCAREMWQRCDWILPTFNGELRTDKPALHYWFMIVAYKLFGFGYWQARFFSACMGLGTLAVLYWGTRKCWNATVAVFSMAALAASPHFLFEFRLSVPDPYLIFFTTCGMFSGLLYCQTLRWKWVLLSSVSLGLATLAKGPVALALPGLCLLIYLLLQKKWNVLRDAKWLAAAFLYLLITVPWYWMVHVKSDGAFTEGFFLDHNLNRFSDEKEGHGANFFIVPLMVLVGMLPFSVFIFSGVKKSNGLLRQPLFLFSCITALCYVIFFGFSSTKLPNYPMPAYPLMAILCGGGIFVLWGKRKFLPLYALVIWTILGLALALGGYFGIGAELAVADLSYLTLGLGVVAIVALLIWVRRSQIQFTHQLILVAAAWWLMAAYAFWFAYPAIYLRNPASNAYKQIISPGTRLLAYKAFNPAFLVQHPQNNYVIGMANDTAALRKMLLEANASQTVVITREEHLKDLPEGTYAEIFRAKDLFELPTTVLLKPLQAIKK